MGLSLDWTVAGSYRFAKAAHVNIPEARAISRCVKKQARLAQQPFRMILLSDSMVCVGALGKGRSSSFQLNGVLRSMLGGCVVSGIDLSILWISTKCNPADFPSRFLQTPPLQSFLPGSIVTSAAVWGNIGGATEALRFSLAHLF